MCGATGLLRLPEGVACNGGSGKAEESDPGAVLLSPHATETKKMLNTVSRVPSFNWKAPFKTGERSEALGSAGLLGVCVGPCAV